MSAPDLTTRLGANLTLSSPVVAASGTFGYGEELSDLADCGSLGALITPTLTLHPRLGNPPPRTAEASAGLLHAVGLPNPGLDAFLSERLPRLRSLPCPILVSIAAETPADWTELAQRLTSATGLAALELNLTPFALQTADNPTAALPSELQLQADIAAAVAAVRAVTPLPLLAKLPPIGIATATAARTVAEAGADVIAVSQAFPGVAVRLSSHAFRFPGVVGGLTGPCVKPMALFQVWQAATAVSLPILGGGGIMTAEDALEFLLAGASCVAIGTANLVHPAAIARITTDLTAYLKSHHIAHVSELIGVALPHKK